jgi:uncharacterized membrane protein
MANPGCGRVWRAATQSWSTGLTCVLVPVLIVIVLWPAPPFDNLDVITTFTEQQKQTVAMVVEMNKYLISASTLLFGALAYCLSRLDSNVSRQKLIPLIGIVILLGTASGCAALAYSRLLSELAINRIGLVPGDSRVLDALDKEFFSAAGASVLVLIVFIETLLHPKPATPEGGSHA